MLKGKNSLELEKLADDINQSIRDGARQDVEYWEEMRNKILLEKSVVFLKEKHREIVSKQRRLISRLRAERGVEAVPDRSSREDFGPCFEFQRGNCKFGDGCKYSHALPSDDTSLAMLKRAEEGEEAAGDTEEKMVDMT